MKLDKYGPYLVFIIVVILMLLAIFVAEKSDANHRPAYVPVDTPFCWAETDWLQLQDLHAVDAKEAWMAMMDRVRCGVVDEHMRVSVIGRDDRWVFVLEYGIDSATFAGFYVDPLSLTMEGE